MATLTSIVILNAICVGPMCKFFDLPVGNYCISNEARKVDEKFRCRPDEINWSIAHRLYDLLRAGEGG